MIEAETNPEPTSSLKVESKAMHKPWKVYFLEFILIFLAVVLGFFAESIREDLGEREMEKEYIQSMIEDAILDTLNINAALAENSFKILALDSLGKMLTHFEEKEGEEARIYRLYRIALGHPDLVAPTERTLVQLKHAGAMRLIQKKKVVDAILRYDELCKNLLDQQGYYEKYQNAAIEKGFELFNFSAFMEIGPWIASNSNPFEKAKMLSRDRQKLIELGNRIYIYSGVVLFYNDRLFEVKKQAIRLIQTLKMEYQLKRI